MLKRHMLRRRGCSNLPPIPVPLPNQGWFSNLARNSARSEAIPRIDRDRSSGVKQSVRGKLLGELASRCRRVEKQSASRPGDCVPESRGYPGRWARRSTGDALLGTPDRRRRSLSRDVSTASRPSDSTSSAMADVRLLIRRSRVSFLAAVPEPRARSPMASVPSTPGRPPPEPLRVARHRLTWPAGPHHLAAQRHADAVYARPRL